MAAISVGFLSRLGNVVIVPNSTSDGTPSNSAAGPSSVLPPSASGGTAESGAVGKEQSGDSAIQKASQSQSLLQTAIVYFLTAQSL